MSGTNLALTTSDGVTLRYVDGVQCPTPGLRRTALTIVAVLRWQTPTQVSGPFN